MRPLKAFRVGIAWLAFITMRRLERIFSVTLLRCVMTPFISLRVACKRKHSSIPLPECLCSGTGVSPVRTGTHGRGARATKPNQFRISKQWQRQDRLNAALEFFPDRLDEPKWRDRLKIRGLEYLETARRQKRPVVLAFCHFGRYSLLRYWLRAAGYPAAMVVKGRSEDRSPLKRLKDRYSPFPKIPTAFYNENQLREMIEFVAAGNPLLMALDVKLGKKLHVPVDDDWQFRMSSGPIRLAMRQRAELMACLIVDHGGWNFEITLGPPVPVEVIESGNELRAGEHLLETILPILRAHPEQCIEMLVKAFQPAVSGNRFVNEAIPSGQFVAG
ncbi:MAG TPA: hypothetical protein VN873_03815 [Candidatus Angelobacter sp.]|nr:hypothetical protein [Candidatus Angelobacter sp.]